MTVRSRAPVSVVGAIGVVFVLAASAVGIVLSRIGCGDSLAGFHGAYCGEAPVVGVGIGVTVGLLGPAAVTAIAAVLSVRGRRIGMLLLVTLIMALVGVLFPWVLWR